LMEVCGLVGGGVVGGGGGVQSELVAGVWG
jgi:hypothetical protein